MNTGNSNNNPFKAPAARVADAIPGNGEFIQDGRRVPAGSALSWIGRGWAMFRASPGTWIGLGVIFMIIAGIFTITSFTSLIFNLVAPVLVGGIMIGCHAQEEDEDLRVMHLFAGFSEHFGKLALIGLLYLAGIFAIGLVIGLTGFSTVVAGAAGTPLQFVWSTAILTTLVSLFLFVPLGMATCYAPALVVLHELSPLQAMRSSFFGCLRNVVPLLIYALLFVILAILASLPLGLGWLVLTPVFLGSIYAGYRDIFTDNP